MYNWNTDVTKFKTAHQKKIWELVQSLQYGAKKKLSKSEIKKNWSEIKTQLDPEARRLVEYLVWDKVSSLPINNGFWTSLLAAQSLQTLSI